MPKLLEAPLARPGAAVLTNPDQQGGGAVQGHSALAQGLGAVGEAYSAYRDLQADVGVREYETRLSELRLELTQVADPTERESIFEERRGRLREQVAAARPFANRVRFDRNADLSDDDSRVRVRERALQDTLNGIDTAMVETGNFAARAAADADDLEDAIIEVDRYFEDVGALVEAGQMDPARSLALRESVAIATIRTRAETDPDGAQDLLERYQGVIDPGRMATLRQVVDEEATVIEAQTLSDTAFELFGRDTDAREAWIRENSSGVVRDEALSTSRSRHSAAEAERKRKQAEAFDTSAASIREFFADEPPPAAELGPAWQEFRRQARRSGLGETAVGQLRSLFDALAEPAPVQTDWGVYNEVYSNPDLYGTPGYTEAELAMVLEGDVLNRVRDRSINWREGNFGNNAQIDSVVDNWMDRYEVTDDRDQGAIRDQIRMRIQDAGSSDIPTVEAITRQVFDAYNRTGSWRPNANESAAETVEAASNATPGRYWYAYWQASRDGTRRPTNEQIAVQLDAIERRVERSRLHRGEATREHQAYLQSIDDAGRSVVENLWRARYEHLDDLKAEDELRRLEAEQREQQQADRAAELARMNAELEAQAELIRAPVREAVRAALLGDDSVDPRETLRQVAGDQPAEVREAALREVEAEVREQEGIPEPPDQTPRDRDLDRRLTQQTFFGALLRGPQ